MPFTLTDIAVLFDDPAPSFFFEVVAVSSVDAAVGVEDDGVDEAFVYEVSVEEVSVVVLVASADGLSWVGFFEPWWLEMGNLVDYISTTCLLNPLKVEHYCPVDITYVYIGRYIILKC